MSGVKISGQTEINPSSSAEKNVPPINAKSSEASFADPLVTETISNASTHSKASSVGSSDKDRPSVTINTSGVSLNKGSADKISHSDTTQASQETIKTGSTAPSGTSVTTPEGTQKSLQSILSKKSMSRTTLTTSKTSSLGIESSDITMSSSRRSRASSKRMSSIFKRPSVPESTISFRNPLDDMTNAALVNAVTELEKSAKHLELENMVFLHFLEKNEPSLLEGMDNVLKNVQTIQDRASLSSKRLTLTRASRQSTILSYSTSSITPTVLEKEGPRINITQKTDLILREMDNIQAALNKINRKCYVIRHKLKAELEEMAIRESEIQEIKDTFERTFITNELSEKYSQKNPADRFCRFMDETFKKTGATIDKLRLRTSSLKVQYQKICAQLTQKKLLGEHLQEVDFEQLEIDNKHLREKIDKRNLLLLELKRMNGRANLLLSNQKKHLLKKVTDLKVYQDTIKMQEELVRKIDDECEKVSEELEATKEEHDKIKTKSENYEVPSVLEYVKKKAELGLLKKNLKIWERRKQIKEMALTASVREMKHATGLPAAKSSWFINPHDMHRGRGSVESTFEFMFERKMRLSLIMQKKKSRRRKTQSMDYSVGSLSDLITGSNTPNKKNVVRKKISLKNTESTSAPQDSDEPSEFQEKKPKKKVKESNTKKSKKRKLETSDESEPVVKKEKNSENAERRVNSKEKKEKFEEDPEKLSRTVFIGNLPISSNTKQIKQFFKKYGNVESVRIRGVPVADPKLPKKVAMIKREFHPDRKGFHGYIRFESRDDAIKSTEADGVLFQEHHLRVCMCDAKESPDEDKAIFVGNLSFYAEEDDLWKTFESCGPIASVRIVRDGKTGIGKGFGFVNFKNSDSVTLALEMENVTLKDRELRIKLYNFKAAKNDKKMRKAKKVINAGKRRYAKNAEKTDDVKGEFEEKLHLKGNQAFQGVKHAEKKKKKFNKGLLQKKKLVKQIAPK
ncbi:uncharacterized protein LOC100142251 [Tribolium castaneum]